MKMTLKSALIVLAATVMSLSASAQRGRTLADFETDFDYVEGRDFDYVEDRDSNFDRDRRGPAPRRQVIEFPLFVHQDIVMDGDRLPIKRMLQNQYPRRNFDNFNLRAVVLVSKAGRRGLDAQLLAGRFHKSRLKALPFSGRGSFRQPGNFGRVRFMVPPQNRNGRGRIQVVFSGNGRGKIKEVIVRAVRIRGGRGGRLQYTEVDTFRAEKFFELTQRIRVRQQDVKGIKIEASRNPVDVTSVVVVYGNGDREFLPALEGAINKNDSKEARLGRRGQTVRRLEITATSLLPWGPRGELKVSVGQ